VRRPSWFVLAGLFLAAPLVAQDSGDAVTQALSRGDLYASRKKYELALDAYHKADKLSHHGSAQTYLKLATVERKLGDFSSALDDAKKAVKVAGDDKSVALQAHLLRATLLSQMSGKPTDKKLKEAEDEIRQALSLDSGNALARYDLGFVLLKQERDPEGTAELKTFLSSSGADAESLEEARKLIANPLRARAPFAPDFSFMTVQNQTVSNAALRGKVVLMDFWGTWCPPCRESVPALRELNKKYAGKPFQLVSVSSDDDEDVWKTFIKSERMDWSQYIDLQGRVLHSFKVESFPTFVVLDKDGVIRFRQSGEGPTTEADLEDAIGKYIKRESDPKLAAAAAAEASSASADSTTESHDNASLSLSATGNATVSGSSSKGRKAIPEDADSGVPGGIEGVVVAGNTYKNAALGMTFQFPQGWVVANGETLHAANERLGESVKAALLKLHPEITSSTLFAVPKIVFYASRKGSWDGQRMEIPSIKIQITPSDVDSVKLDRFQHLAERQAAATGMKLIGTASEFQVNKHAFVRADFERTVGALHMYQSLVQTIAGDYALNIEIYAYSVEELQQVGASLQSMSITDED
jgi:thiol-disulfide isomerase/thioredoxin